MKNNLNLANNDLKAIQEFTQKVKDTLKTELISLKLFGSKARGDSQSGSDIDMLLVIKTEDTAIEDQILDIAFEVNLVNDVYISPRVIPLLIFNNPVWKSTLFIQNLEKESIPL